MENITGSYCPMSAQLSSEKRPHLSARFPSTKFIVIKGVRAL